MTWRHRSADTGPYEGPDPGSLPAARIDWRSPAADDSTQQLWSKGGSSSPALGLRRRTRCDHGRQLRAAGQTPRCEPWEPVAGRNWEAFRGRGQAGRIGRRSSRSPRRRSSASAEAEARLRSDRGSVPRSGRLEGADSRLHTRRREPSVVTPPAEPGNWGDRLRLRRARRLGSRPEAASRPLGDFRTLRLPTDR